MKVTNPPTNRKFKTQAEDWPPHVLEFQGSEQERKHFKIGDLRWHIIPNF